MRAFSDAEGQTLFKCHVLEVSFFVWAAIYVDWEDDGRVKDKPYFVSIIRAFFENSNFQVRLYQCFRGGENAITSSVKDVFNAIEAECKGDFF